MNYKVNPKENFYFFLLCVINACLYVSAIYFFRAVLDKISLSTIVLYSISFASVIWLQSIMLIGYLRGHAIKVSDRQFPEAYALLKQHAQSLQLSVTPEMFVLHGHGVLNAFAMRLARRNYVVLYSDVLELAYRHGENELSFIIGHEVGHIKRGHVGWLKTIATWPASLIPFLGSAYSRAREYTCDNIGFYLCPEGAAKGILVLAVGKRLYNKVDIEQALVDFKAESGFAVTLVELFSTHPVLLKRVESLQRLRQENFSQ